MTMTCFVIQASEQERETFFKGELTSGGFGGIDMRIAKINGETSVMLGGKGAWLVNHQFYLGGGGLSTLNTIGVNNYDFNYGGLMLGFIFKPKSAVNLNLEIIAGPGSLSSNDNSYDDSIWVVEPAVYAHFNVIDFLKIAAGISYRSVHESDTENSSDSDLSGVSFNLSILFGKY